MSTRACTPARLLPQRHLKVQDVGTPATCARVLEDIEGYHGIVGPARQEELPGVILVLWSARAADTAEPQFTKPLELIGALRRP